MSTSPSTATPAQHGIAGRVQAAVADVARAAEALDQAIGARDSAIRAALEGGVSPTVIAAEIGVSRQRIYQIRDGVR